MKLFVQFLFCAVFANSGFSQEHSRFAISAYFGPNGNFNANDYFEGGPGIVFYDKSFVGISAGVEAKYSIGNRSYLNLGYMESTNNRVVDFTGINNGITLNITDFTLRQKQHTFLLGYERILSKKSSDFKLQGGGYYVRFALQEISLYNNLVIIEERNTANGGMNELGFFVGVHYSHFINNNFEVGIQSRFFYVVSAVFVDQLTLTPTLTYHFSKSGNKKKAKP